MTLARKPPIAETSPGAGAPPIAPSYGPGFVKRQPVALPLRQIAPGTQIDYDRSITVERTPDQVIPLRNSDFSPLMRGPIRNYWVRDWYWRGWWQAFSDDTFPNAHVPIVFLPNIDGTIMGLPSGAAMVPRPSLRFVLHTPAWTINPPSEDATQNA